MISAEKYSVLMSLYKKENPVFFKQALDSMIDQSVAPDEIVIVEDGPLTKELYDVLDDYKLNYPDLIKIVISEENIGLGRALNLGLQHCRNELVARMDTDDISLPNRCEKQLNFLQDNPMVDIIGGNISEFIDDKRDVGFRIVPQEHEDICKFLKKRCPFNHMTVFFKKSSVQKSGGYLDCFCNEDYYLWIRMWENNMVFANINEVLVNARIGKEMYARRGGKEYFKSELFLQKYMLQIKLINYVLFLQNIVIRYVVEVLMNNKLRSWFYRKIARRQQP